MGDLNPFRYSLAEVSKFLIAAIGFIGYVVVLFVSVSPGLIGAIQALVVPAVGLLAIFAVGNHTSSEYNKAIVAFLTAAITVYQYFGHLAPSTETKLFVAAGALATTLAVLLKGGAPVGGLVSPPQGVSVHVHLDDQLVAKASVATAGTAIDGSLLEKVLPIDDADGGGSYFRLVAPENHSVLLTSEIYTTREHAREGRAAAIRVFAAAMADATSRQSPGDHRP